ncbi:hypothetical protein Lgra_1937 [Legionella gratiana]|uniref:Uncharacterized protein n=1 Tax=Legionella gratiana TaxID=45066 RepID=A0A378JEB6_9GAMM|nr:hypothetical protein [Legionella gratiana]KTD10971.1 hypothetical protein Lgra_1937 [Legionella gratiana]STX45945.1 Uncharacterised protein [Legionella gratiana]
MHITKYILPVFISMSLYAYDSDYIGTRSNPIPLKGGIFGVLESVTIYLYQDMSFDITDNNILILKGTFINNTDSISYSDHIAFSNKVYIESNGKKKTCLQTVLYKPDIYSYKTDWFCPA